MSTEATISCYTASAVSTAVVVDLNGFQSILSIICMIITILGVSIPGIIKIIAKIKKYYSDKKLSAEELNDIANDIEKTANQIKDTIDNNKSEK